MWRYIRPTTLAKLVVWAVLQVIFYRYQAHPPRLHTCAMDLGHSPRGPHRRLRHRLEFGLVFFIASCCSWVWDSMSSSSSSASTVDGERVSASSVFNRGVNALPGSLPHHRACRVRVRC